MSNPTPYLWVFAGPNGAGKSTLVARYLRNRLPVINPDVIAVSLRADHPERSAVIKAAKIAIRERAVLLAARQSFAIETTLSGHSEIRLINDAVSAGYKVNLVFVGVNSAQISQSRVAHRVRMGLHIVPHEDIVRRYRRSMEHLAFAMKLATRSIVVDNTGKSFRLLLIRENGRAPTVAKKLPSWLIEAVPEEFR
jgi:predicted ABC-type ATPase